MEKRANYLEGEVTTNAKKFLVKCHAKYLLAMADSEAQQRKKATDEKSEAQKVKKGTPSGKEKLQNLYGLLFD